VFARGSHQRGGYCCFVHRREGGLFMACWGSCFAHATCIYVVRCCL
jgi:hypothetical protein